jgi:S-DNA-T family DNA segregation ATPase FtsK/SpoIIIE
MSALKNEKFRKKTLTLLSQLINELFMAKKKSTKEKENKGKSKTVSFFRFMASERGQFLTGVCLAFFAAFMLLGMISFFFTGAADQAKVVNKPFLYLISNKQEITNWTGVGGAFIGENLINNCFGIFSLAIPVFIGIIGVRLMKVAYFSLLRSFLLSAFVLIWGSLASAFVLNKLFGDSHINWGGSHGLFIEQILESAIGIFGVVMVIVLLMIVFIVIIRHASIPFFRKIFGQPFRLRSKSVDVAAPDEKEESDNEIYGENELYWTEKQVSEPVKAPIGDDADFIIDVPADEPVAQPVIPDKNDENQENADELVCEDDDRDLDGMEEMEDYDPTLDLSRFAFPSSELLKIYDYSGKIIDMEEQRANKDRIITTLKNYGVEIKSIKATVGPTITLYEIIPQDGVRISKIKNLENDIALSLAALGIRIIAPMPGKGTIGIEVPNKDPQIVSMQSIISSRVFQESRFDLPVALGKTITNEVFMFDLCKMPHLLVAGATGQGKSVGLNAIITSLLYKKHPAEMKMVLVDPKMVEFNIYSRIEKHYLAKLPDAEKAIITDVSKVTQTLNSLTKEMDDRYELLMAAGVRTIKEYNEKFIKRKLNPLKGHRYLPYIVVIIDEFGDLIMQAGKEIEMPIARIAQKARAVGMHMIIATQRPTTNIITGTIKANFPARMAFRVTSQIDSRTILDQSGANQLIGRGDMLFSSGSDLVRIQCAFVDTPEVEGIAQFIGSQQGYAEAFPLPEFSVDSSDIDKAPVDLNDKDPLFEEAARLIVIHQQGSTSLIQRKFSIGYNRAGRLMDQMERTGIVGVTQGSKPRDVLIADEYSLEKLLDSLR